MFPFGFTMLAPLIITLSSESHARVSPAETPGLLALVTGGDGALSFTLDPLSLTYVVTTSSNEMAFTSNGAQGNGFGYSAGGKTRTLLDGLVQLGVPAKASGSDATGDFESISINFTHRASGEVEWISTVKAYTSRPALVFAQTWPRGVPVAVGGSIFPSLKQRNHHSLGTLEYTGASCGFMVSAKGEYPGITGGQDKGYVVIAPRDSVGGGASSTLAIGPVTEHFVNQASSYNGSSLSYGVAPTFNTLPAGFTVETVLVASTKTSTPPPDDARSSIAPGGVRTRNFSIAVDVLRLSPPCLGVMLYSQCSVLDAGWLGSDVRSCPIHVFQVNAALMEFGDFLLARHGKTRARGDIKRETEYIGYSTTAFYL